MATYYIGTEGTDDVGRNGGIGQEWKTLSYACTRVTTIGDIIHINAGTYTETAQSSLSVGVSIEGDGDTSILTSAAALDPMILLSSGAEGTDGNQSISYIKIDGDLVVVEGIRVLARKNVTIHHITVIDCLEVGAYINGRTSVTDNVATIYATGNSIHDSVFTNCGYDYYNSGANAYWAIGACFQINSQHGFLGYNNVLDNITGGRYCYTIRGQHQKGTKIYNNHLSTSIRNETGRMAYSFAIEWWTGHGGVEVYDNVTTGGIDFGGYGWDDSAGYGFAIKCYRNIIALTNQLPYNSGYNGEAGIVIESGSSGGVYVYRNYIANFSQGFSLSVTAASLVVGHTNVWFYYNIMSNIGYTDHGSGAGIGGYAINDAINVNKPMSNIYYLNNVIHKSTKTSGWGIVYEYSLANRLVWSNFNIKNNIIYNCYSPVMIEYQDIAGLHVDNNIFYEQTNSDTVSVGNGTITDFTENNNQASTNPLFVGGSPYDYHLQESSPAIASGITTDVLREGDYFGNSWNDPPSIGACEYYENIHIPYVRLKKWSKI